jgi:protoporphyrinogen oxidase
MRYGIVGGGLLGMTLAWKLSKAGHDATIFEGASRCGGLAAPWQLGDVVWDRHYHVMLQSDTALRALLRELDLEGDLEWAKPGTGFFVDGTMHSFCGALDYARFPPLSPWQKLRLAATILKASRIKNWRPLERLTAVEWLTRHCGHDTVERIWLPLLRAKLGPYATRASAAFIWAIIARMYAARGSGPNRERFGYVRNGYDRTLRRFEERLTGRGVAIRTSSRIERVEAAGGEVVVVSPAQTHRFDRVIVTLAPPLAARLCPGLSPRERALCEGVEYQGIICASLLADAPLTSYYITNIADASIPFTAVIEMGALADRREFGGKSLIYLPKYVSPDDPAFRSTDAEIENAFLASLRRMHPSFRRETVRAFRVSRVPFVFPIPTVDYSRRLPPMETSMNGLFLLNSAHIVNGTLNVNETLKLAHAALPRLLAPAPAGVAKAAVA